MHLGHGATTRVNTPRDPSLQLYRSERTWVNHSVLYDVAAYCFFGPNQSGMILLLAKALAVALAFGLVIGIVGRGPALAVGRDRDGGGDCRRAAAHALARIGSVLLLAVTLFLLFRLPHRLNSWRFPIAIGIIFWIWANVDVWFFIGPLALALVLVGEVVQKKLLGGTDAKAEPLGPLPDVRTLSRAGIGIVACMLNPHHAGCGTPVENWTKGVNADQRIRNQLL